MNQLLLEKELQIKLTPNSSTRDNRKKMYKDPAELGRLVADKYLKELNFVQIKNN